MKTIQNMIKYNYTVGVGGKTHYEPIKTCTVIEIYRHMDNVQHNKYINVYFGCFLFLV